jgi:hypothetical protein
MTDEIERAATWGRAWLLGVACGAVQRAAARAEAWTRILGWLRRN